MDGQEFRKPHTSLGSLVKTAARIGLSGYIIKTFEIKEPIPRAIAIAASWEAVSFVDRLLRSKKKSRHEDGSRVVENLR